MRHVFLGMLAKGPLHGYELRSALEQTFGALLPAMNSGQIYTTLQRLERDGLVVGADVPDDGRNKRTYELTAAGDAELARWINGSTPATLLRDEFFMKLVLVLKGSRAGAVRLIEQQRREHLQSLRDLADVARRVADHEVAALLVEGAQLHIEADLKWIELCSQRLIAKEE